MPGDGRGRTRALTRPAPPPAGVSFSASLRSQSPEGHHAQHRPDRRLRSAFLCLNGWFKRTPAGWGPPDAPQPGRPAFQLRLRRTTAAGSAQEQWQRPTVTDRPRSPLAPADHLGCSSVSAWSPAARWGLAIQQVLTVTRPTAVLERWWASPVPAGGVPLFGDRRLGLLLRRRARRAALQGRQPT